MFIADVIKELENFAPPSTAEDFDNVGLLVGDPSEKLTGILITLDTLEGVVEEAIENKCNFIVSFHPIIFSGLKKITGSNYVERAVLKAIKNNIAIYAIHTALDNHRLGVNKMICDKLGLQNTSILIPQKKTIKKLTTYVPVKDAEAVRTALFTAGAGGIGNYDNCSFNLQGQGSFKANQDANPSIGKIGEVHFEEEIQINVVFPAYFEHKVIKALFSSHPYEEVAYEVITLDNEYQDKGMGMLGELPEECSEKEFLSLLKETFQTGCIRHSELCGKMVKKVAVLGGSGSFAIENAKRAGANFFVTADLKYHDFYKAEQKLVLADVGHYESEQFTKELIHSFLSKKISNFALILANTKTNPIKYY
ncbi:Nif3-like dinuclear metal center hexameric protein [Antarcticibacterium flavum]|uniref:GTP cyclohydrolase 1 type 2 homolog n=1 Tax=Antarcticibacterium flavum TaxID=2058175 RepID=A0A5B7X6Y0_9FLAO|nr:MULTISPECIES: Nif3-like dinuclear metal center hexameric protein [Antarcticibacterium]MCM4160019.1 Nif3-like dinuclear metal center hexameric protein [Antarcticibacterium sp. W02-3]QCY70393.1 Nif3-like dinuclear metal center hexameric protein [Antarcticibacterium flavum]